MESLTSALLRKLSQASRDFGLLEPDDRVMVCVSGGKDSFALLDLLRLARRRTPFDFSLVAVHLDQGHPGFPTHVIADYLEREGYAHHIVRQNTYAIVQEKVPEGKTTCSLCSRLRRGILYRVAQNLGATKIALGHHREDLLETLLLNLFFSGQLKTMPPRLVSDDGRNVVIRPLAYCAEDDIARYAEARGFPVVPCGLCGSQNHMQRQQVKRLLASLEQGIPGLRASMLAALGNVRTSHLLDRRLRPAERLAASEQGSSR